VIENQKDGGAVITGDSIELYSLIAARMAMRIWVQSNGQMKLTRNGTPANLARRFGLKGRTAKQVLPQIQKMIDEYANSNG